MAQNDLHLYARASEAEHEARATIAELEARIASHAAEIQRATSAERQRCKEILTSNEAEGRQAQARVFAFDSDVSETLAAQLLAAQPKDATAQRIPSIAERAAEQEAQMAYGRAGWTGGVGSGYGGDFMADRRAASDPLTASIKALNDAARSR